MRNEDYHTKLHKNQCTFVPILNHNYLCPLSGNWVYNYLFGDTMISAQRLMPRIFWNRIGSVHTHATSDTYATHKPVHNYYKWRVSTDRNGKKIHK